MAESTVVYTPDNNQANNILPWVFAANNGLGGLGGNGLLPGMMLGSGMGMGSFGGIGGGWAGAGLAFLIGLLFGNGRFGNLLGGGDGSGAGFLSNQINNDSGRELLMNAITSQGEASRSAVQNLATMLGQDFNLVNADVESLKSALSTLALQQAVSVPQIINAIQSGNTTLMSKLCECCCENRLLTTQQGYESQIRTLEQTNQLGSQADRNTGAIIGAIKDQTVVINDGFCAIKEREMQAEINRQAEIITQLRNQADNANQTAAFAAMLAPINAKLVEIESKQPSTVPVQWPNLAAVNTTPYVSGGYYQGGFNGFYGPGVGGFGGF